MHPHWIPPDQLCLEDIQDWQRKKAELAVVQASERLLRSRLFVYTYNSTGFLETLGRNIPTVMFWNPDCWELRAEARPLFETLAGAGIFFQDPVAAAKHVNAVWHDVAGWWSQDSVQSAVRAFCAQYVRSVENPESRLLSALTFDRSSSGLPSLTRSPQ